MTREDKQPFAVPEEDQIKESFPNELQKNQLEATVEMLSKRNWKKNNFIINVSFNHHVIRSD